MTVSTLDGVGACALIPALRAAGAGSSALLTQRGIELHALADPLSRVSVAVAYQLLQELHADQPAFALWAGTQGELSELHAFGHGLRCCATLRQALHWAAAHLELLTGAFTCQLIEDNAGGSLVVRATEARMAARCGDYVLALALTWVRQLVRDTHALAVQLAHRPLAPESEYERVFGTACLRFSAARNALIFTRVQLDAPLRTANDQLLALFEAQAASTLQQLRSRASLAGRVKVELARRLQDGSASMRPLAKHMRMSSSTLRRQLAREGRTFSSILDEARFESAQTMLADTQLTAAEVAERLGYANPSSLCRSFARWLPGATPLTFRRSLKRTIEPRAAAR